MENNSQLPWQSETEFYNLHTNIFLGKGKFYHAYMIGKNDQEFAAYIIGKLNLTPTSNVVDLGCGSGYLVSEISKICNCVGISTSSENIKVKNVTHFLALESIGYANIERTFNNIYSNLVDGGIFYLKDNSYISNTTLEEKENLAYWENYWKYSTLNTEDMITQGYKTGFKLNLFRDLSDDPRLNTSLFLKSLNKNLVKECYPHPNIYVHIGTEFIFQKLKRQKWLNPYL